MADAQDCRRLQPQMFQQLFYIPSMKVIAVFSRPFFGLAYTSVIKSNTCIEINETANLGVPGVRIAPNAIQHYHRRPVTIELIEKIHSITRFEIHAEIRCFADNGRHMLHAKGRASFNSRFGASGVSTHAQSLHMGALQELVALVEFPPLITRHQAGAFGTGVSWNDDNASQRSTKRDS